MALAEGNTNTTSNIKTNSNIIKCIKKKLEVKFSYNYLLSNNFEQTWIRLKHSQSKW